MCEDEIFSDDGNHNAYAFPNSDGTLVIACKINKHAEIIADETAGLITPISKEYLRRLLHLFSHDDRILSSDDRYTTYHVVKAGSDFLPGMALTKPAKLTFTE